MAPRLKYWIPAICVAIVISVFSSHYFSGEETARVIIPILHRIFPFATDRELRWMHIGIRKLAHVTEFGTFSIAVFHGVRAGRSGWNLRWAIITLVIAVSYAGLDEWHQSFVPAPGTPSPRCFDRYGGRLVGPGPGMGLRTISEEIARIQIVLATTARRTLSCMGSDGYLLLAALSGE